MYYKGFAKKRTELRIEQIKFFTFTRHDGSKPSDEYKKSPDK